MSDKDILSRATPAQMRESLKLVEALTLDGLRFVPIPCTSDGQFIELTRVMESKLENIIKRVEGAKKGG